MKFILAEDQETKLSLKDVEENQFFVNSCDCLCQKVTPSSYSIIANEDGKPYGVYFSGQSINMQIKKVLPKVVKIEF